MKTKVSVSPLPSAFLLYLVLAAVYISRYRFQINPDGISYLSIAGNYLAGDWATAINGYWSPLYSWLLAPFLFLGISGLLSTKLLSVLAGVFALHQIFRLIYSLRISRAGQWLLALGLPVLILDFSFTVISPDLLFLAVFMLILNRFFSHPRPSGTRAGFLTGILGGCLFLTKSVGFPLFLASALVLITGEFQYFRDLETRKKTLSGLGRMMAGFLLITVPWVVTISLKYDRFTLSTSGTYNLTVSGTGLQNHPMHSQGLLDPPNDTAISVWEDISYTPVDPPDSPAGQGPVSSGFTRLVHNLGTSAGFFFRFSWLTPVLLFSVLFFLWQTPGSHEKRLTGILLLLSLVQILGYSLIWVESRYLWFAQIALLLTGLRSAEALLAKTGISDRGRKVVLGILLISVLPAPVYDLDHDYRPGKVIQKLGDQLGDYPVSGSVASMGSWEKSLFLSYHRNWRYYGEVRGSEPARIADELAGKNIDWLLVWKPASAKYPFGNRYPEVTQGKIPNLQIYRLKP